MHALNKFTTITHSMPLIAILRGIHPSEIIEISHTLIDAGIKIIEVPLNSPDPLNSIERLCTAFKNDALCGAGTVTNLAQLKHVLKVGAELIIAPNTNINIITHSINNGAISIPGCATASEMFNAIDAGAHAIKFFPATEQSEKTLSALKSVLPNTIPIYPVGGINLNNIETFLDAGASGFGIGSSLYKPGMSAKEIKPIAIQYVQRIKELLNQTAGKVI